MKLYRFRYLFYKLTTSTILGRRLLRFGFTVGAGILYVIQSLRHHLLVDSTQVGNLGKCDVIATLLTS